MVTYKDILASNALINDATAPRVAVFVGGTSGIGKLTIEALVKTGVSTRIYLVGRKSAEERSKTFIEEQKAINPKAEIIWTEGEISLLEDSKRICQVIKSKESRIDLLFFSAGYAPFGKRQETAEGHEVVQVLEYYSRVLFILSFLPLLHAAEAPRVVAVGGGGLEWSKMEVDDIDFKKPGSFSAFKARPHYIMQNTMGLEVLSNENPDITFIHSWPGLVNTGNIRRGRDPNSWPAWIIRTFIEPVLSLFSFDDEHAGQRYLFETTSAAFGGRGVPWTGKPGVNSLVKEENGLFLTNYKNDCTPNEKAVASLRETAQKKIWEHTQEVLRPYL